MNIALIADVLWINDSTYSKGDGTNPHTHETYYHLIFCQEGCNPAQLNDKKFVLHSNEWMLACPKDIHSIDQLTKEGETLHIWEVKFTVLSKPLQRALTHIEKIQTSDTLFRELVTQLMLVCQGNAGRSGIEARRYYLCALLYYLCKDVLALNESINVGNYLQGMDVSSYTKATLKVVQYLDNHYCEDVSLDAIGTETGYNKKYLSTVFKKDLSISINDYLMLLRIQKAIELLVFSDINVTKLYKEVGFNNNNNFNRVFKKMIGVPPSQYRKSYPDGTKIATPDDTSLPVWVNRRAVRME